MSATVSLGVESVAGLTDFQAAILRGSEVPRRASAQVRQLSVTLTGPLDLDRAATAVRLLALRHEVLRSVVVHRGLPRPVQAILTQRDIPVEYADVRGLDAITRGRRSAQLKVDALRRGFDLDGVLFRVLFVRQGENQALMVWTYHQIILDHRSLDRLLRDFLIYEARLALGADLPALEWEARVRALAGPRFHTWVREQLHQPVDVAYWRDVVEAAHPVRPPTLAGARDRAASSLKAERTVTLDRTVTAALVTAAAAAGVTPATLVEAAWGLVLQRVTGQRPVVFGRVVSRRPGSAGTVEPGIGGGGRAGSDGFGGTADGRHPLPGSPWAASRSVSPGAGEVDLVGQCATVLAIRVDAPDEATVGELLTQVSAAAAAGDRRVRGPLGARDVDLDRGVGGTFVTWVDALAMPTETGPGLPAAAATGPPGPLRLRFDSTAAEATVPLAIAALPLDEGELRLVAQYDRAFYAAPDADRVLVWLTQALRGLAGDRAQRLDAIDIAPPGELDAVLERFNRWPQPRPSKTTLTTLIAERAAEQPSAVALIAAGREYTRADLARASAVVAERLVAAGVHRGDRVAVWTDRRVELAPTLLGLWRVGAAYVPIDPATPVARQAAIVADAQPTALIGLGLVPPEVVGTERQPLVGSGLAGTQCPRLVVDESVWTVGAPESDASGGVSRGATRFGPPAAATRLVATSPVAAALVAPAVEVAAAPLIALDVAAAATQIVDPVSPTATSLVTPPSVVAATPLVDSVSPAATPLVDSVSPAATPPADPVLAAAPEPDDAAYCLYPAANPVAGVVVSHRALSAYCLDPALDAWFDHERPRVVAVSELTAASFWTEWLLPLVRGCPIVVAEAVEIEDPTAFAHLVWNTRVTIVQTTPSRLDHLTGDAERLGVLTDLQTIVLGGEPFQPQVMRHLQPYTSATWYYVYGQPETGVWATLAKVTDPDQVDIGRPLAACRAAVLDGGRTCGVGQVGELCLGGAILADGYLGRPDLTQARFTANAAGVERLFRTGDRARWLPTGRLALVEVRLDNSRLGLGTGPPTGSDSSGDQGVAPDEGGARGTDAGQEQAADENGPPGTGGDRGLTPNRDGPLGTGGDGGLTPNRPGPGPLGTGGEGGLTPDEDGSLGDEGVVQDGAGEPVKDGPIEDGPVAEDNEPARDSADSQGEASQAEVGSVVEANDLVRDWADDGDGQTEDGPVVKDNDLVRDRADGGDGQAEASQVGVGPVAEDNDLVRDRADDGDGQTEDEPVVESNDLVRDRGNGQTQDHAEPAGQGSWYPTADGAQPTTGEERPVLDNPVLIGHGEPATATGDDSSITDDPVSAHENVVPPQPPLSVAREGQSGAEPAGAVPATDFEVALVASQHVAARHLEQGMTGIAIIKDPVSVEGVPSWPVSVAREGQSGIEPTESPADVDPAAALAAEPDAAAGDLDPGAAGGSSLVPVDPGLSQSDLDPGEFAVGVVGVPQSDVDPSEVPAGPDPAAAALVVGSDVAAGDLAPGVMGDGSPVSVDLVSAQSDLESGEFSVGVVGVPQSDVQSSEVSAEVDLAAAALITGPDASVGEQIVSGYGSSVSVDPVSAEPDLGSGEFAVGVGEPQLDVDPSTASADVDPAAADLVVGSYVAADDLAPGVTGGSSVLLDPVRARPDLESGEFAVGVVGEHQLDDDPSTESAYVDPAAAALITGPDATVGEQIVSGDSSSVSVDPVSDQPDLVSGELVVGVTGEAQSGAEPTEASSDVDSTAAALVAVTVGTGLASRVGAESITAIADDGPAAGVASDQPGGDSEPDLINAPPDVASPNAADAELRSFEPTSGHIVGVAGSAALESDGFGAADGTGASAVGTGEAYAPLGAARDSEQRDSEQRDPEQRDRGTVPCHTAAVEGAIVVPGGRPDLTSHSQAESASPNVATAKTPSTDKPTPLSVTPVVVQPPTPLSPFSPARADGHLDGPVDSTPLLRRVLNADYRRSGAFSRALALQTHERLDPRTLAVALRALAQHHDTLRTICPYGDLIIRPAAEANQAYRLEVVNLPPGPADPAAVERYLVRTRSFDLITGPLLHATVFQGDPTGDRLILNAHRVIADDQSWRILVQDLAQAYEQARDGRPVKLEPSAATWTDWTNAIDQAAAGLDDGAYDAVRELEARAAAADVRTLLGQASGPLAQSGAAARLGHVVHRLVVDLAVSDCLLGVVGRPRPQFGPGDVITAAAALAIRDTVGMSAVTVERVVDGRAQAPGELDFSRTVGWLTAAYPVIVDVRGAPAEVLATVAAGPSVLPGGPLAYGVARERLFAPTEPAVLVIYHDLGHIDPAADGEDQTPPIGSRSTGFPLASPPAGSSDGSETVSNDPFGLSARARRARSDRAAPNQPGQPDQSLFTLSDWPTGLGIDPVNRLQHAVIVEATGRGDSLTIDFLADPTVLADPVATSLRRSFAAELGRLADHLGTKP